MRDIRKRAGAGKEVWRERIDNHINILLITSLFLPPYVPYLGPPAPFLFLRGPYFPASAHREWLQSCGEFLKSKGEIGVRRHSDRSPPFPRAAPHAQIAASGAGQGALAAAGHLTPRLRSGQAPSRLRRDTPLHPAERGTAEPPRPPSPLLRQVGKGPRAPARGTACVRIRPAKRTPPPPAGVARPTGRVHARRDRGSQSGGAPLSAGWRGAAAARPRGEVARGDAQTPTLRLRLPGRKKVGSGQGAPQLSGRPQSQVARILSR